MLVAGILWGNSPKRPRLITQLKKVTNRLIHYDAQEIDQGSMHVCLGKVSNNDHDEVLVQGSQILLGRLFDKQYNKPMASAQLQMQTVDSLLRDFWGKYLFFLQDDRGIPKILRDPTGQLPLFYALLPEGGIIFASELCIVYDVLGSEPSPNWPYLASYILHNNASNTTQTAFEGIYEVPPGCALTYKGNTPEVKMAYDPSEYCQNREMAPQDLVHTIESSLKAWSEPYQNILLSLSGGLDSTSLLYCLNRSKRPDQSLRALNVLHPQVRASNELQYAQKPCDDLGVELTTLDMSDNLPFTPPKNKLAIRPNKPFPSLTHMRYIEALSERIHNKPSTFFVSGHGGDHIFLAPPHKTLLIDYLVDHGVRGARAKLDELAHYYRTSVYQILKDNLSAYIKYRLLRTKKETVNNTAAWVTPELQTLGSTAFLSPLYDVIKPSARVGKYHHMESFDDAIASIGMELGDHNPVHFPLLYQPCFEMALSIPTYQLLHNGYDRYSFRQAISSTFNTNHVWRRSKGETSGTLQLGLKHNLSLIKQLCLDGKFAQSGLVERSKLEQHLRAFSGGEPSNLWIFMNLISTELFFDQWR